MTRKFFATEKEAHQASKKALETVEHSEGFTISVGENKERGWVCSFNYEEDDNNDSLDIVELESGQFFCEGQSDDLGEFELNGDSLGDVFRQFRQRVDDYNNPRGNCYRFAGEACAYGHHVIDWPSELMLCHGYPTGIGGETKGIKFGHAWCENQDETLVFDPTIRPEPFDLDEYYQTHNIDPNEVTCFSRSEVLKNIREKDNWGPWNEVPADAVLGD